MAVSLVQWRGEIGVFHGKCQVYFHSSSCCSVAAMSYASISYNFCFTKLLTLVLITFFSGILLSYHKKINGNVFMIKPYIRSITYFLITWSLLKYIWYDSRIIILSGDIETNPGPKHSFSSQGLKICHWNLNSFSSHMYKTPKLHLMVTIWKYLQECITFEIRIGRKCCKFICLYSCQSQTNDEFESFLKTFELNLDKIYDDNPFTISVFIR